MRIFVTGGSGLIGSRLKKRLRDRGDDIVILTRRPEALAKEPGIVVLGGDPTERGSWMDAIKDCDAVVNLVGEGIFNKRWSPAFKETLIKSRVASTKNVAAALAATPKKTDGSAKVIISASAIGYYGVHGAEEVTEAGPPGNDFMAQICVQWENATQEAAAAGVRVVMLRVGVVLDRNGGALKKMLLPFKMFVGGPVGNGQQYLSWIHHDDLVGQILFALDRANVTGPLNGTAPKPVTNAEFSKALGKALGRPSFLPTPTFMLRLAMGEVAGVITTGQRVLPKASLDAGYAFRFRDVDAALSDILG
jgi:uncharacterized protein (TIGR01777 family)